MSRSHQVAVFQIFVVCLVAGSAALSATPSASVPERHEVRVMGFHFDPVAEGEPALPPHLRAPAAGGAGFRLIQLAGKTRSE